MLAVAVAWQVYEWTGSATALGLIGFLHAIPLLVLTLPAGHLADRFNRKMDSLRALFSTGACPQLWPPSPPGLSSFPNGPASLQSANRLIERIALVFEHQVGTGSTEVRQPGIAHRLPDPVPHRGGAGDQRPRPDRPPPATPAPEGLQQRRDLERQRFGIGNVAGPALGGFVIAWAGFLGRLPDRRLLRRRLPRPAPARPLPADPWRTGLGGIRGSLLAGLRFVWSDKRILSSITLDLFAVLFGGAIALLPIFADRILHVGPVGLGWLRAAPAIGSMTMALTLAHLPPDEAARVHPALGGGRFGLAMVGFGLSTWFPLSFLFLLLSGRPRQRQCRGPALAGPIADPGSIARAGLRHQPDLHRIVQ